MPNASLCGKAVVEMILGEESNAPYDYVAERLVKTGDLPQAYVITPQRIERAKAMDSVRVQDEKMEVGVKSVDDMMHAQKKATTGFL